MSPYLFLLRRNLGEELVPPLGGLPVVVPCGLVRRDGGLIFALVHGPGAVEVIELPRPALVAPPVGAPVRPVLLVGELLGVDGGLGDAVHHGLLPGVVVLHPGLDPCCQWVTPAHGSLLCICMRGRSSGLATACGYLPSLKARNGVGCVVVSIFQLVVVVPRSGKIGIKNHVEQKKLAKILTGFDGVAPPDKIGRGGPRAEKGRGASPTVHNTNPSVIAIGIFARGAIRVSLALSNTRGVKLSLLSLCALISLPPCQPLNQGPYNTCAY